MKRFVVLVILLLAGFHAMAGPAADKVKWAFSADKVNDSIFTIEITAKVAKGWHIFSFKPGGDGSLLPPDFTFTSNPDVQLIGKMTEQGKLYHEDTEVMGIINYFKGTVVYRQKAKVVANTVLKGNVYFMVCDSVMCLPPEEMDFQIKMNGKGAAATASGTPAAGEQDDVLAGSEVLTGPQGDSGAIVAQATRADSPKIAATDTVALAAAQTDAADAGHSLWAIFLTGLGAGLVAFITPCIYAMLPVTVSFFTKRSKTRATGIKNAVIYSASIIGIFSLVGVLISLSFSATTMYTISTSFIFNIFVFIIFFIFGISLLGAFEITLPSSWSTKLDTRANSSSFWGIFFMALVLVIVSFSCTSAFISWLIVQIVQAQNRLGGLVGFFGFGVAIAFPFAIFAFFPGLMNNIAKSGGWLNSVKVTMGFLELAMSMKFLSNVDLQYHWHLLDYDVYLSIWIVLFGILGLYLLGKVRFSHDDELPKNIFGHPYLSVTRLGFAIAVLSFTVYMIPGLFGAPLSGISGWLPEKKTSEFKLYENILAIRNGQLTMKTVGNSGSEMPAALAPKKYTDFLESELPGVTAYFDYEEALAASKATNKPVLLDFTGHSCVNCRKMERAVLSKPEVSQQLNEHFILASLYCDDRTKLAPEDVITGEDGDKITTLGAKNLHLEVTKYGEVGQPMYIFVDGDGNVLRNAGGYVDDVDRFLRIMNEVRKAYEEEQKGK